jgi:hypothetical protein
MEGQKTPLQSSHFHAVWLLNEATQVRNLNKDWFSHRIEPTHTLLIGNTFSIKDGEVSYELFKNAHTLWVFPATRLAAIALDRGRFLVDPVGKRMQQREKFYALLKDFGDFFHFYSHGQSVQQERKDAVVARIEELLVEENGLALRDDLLRFQHLNILLMADQPERAKEYGMRYLDDVEHRPLTTKETMYVFWYNLACAHARLGESDLCYQALEKAAEFQHLDAEHLLKDRDLELVKQEKWFGELVERSQVAKTPRTRHFQLVPPAIVTHVVKEGDSYTATLSFSGSLREEVANAPSGVK